MSKPEFVELEEAREELRLSPGKFKALLASARLHVFKVNGKPCCSRKDVERFASERAAPGVATLAAEPEERSAKGREQQGPVAPPPRKGLEKGSVGPGHNRLAAASLPVAGPGNGHGVGAAERAGAQGQESGAPPAAVSARVSSPRPSALPATAAALLTRGRRGGLWKRLPGWKVGLAVLVTLVVLVKTLGGGPSESELRAAAQGVEDPNADLFPHRFAAPGLVEAASGQSGELGFEVSGTIKTIFVEEGATVKAGDKIAELENGQQEAQLGGARAQLLDARSNLQTLQTSIDAEIKRAEALVNRLQAAHAMLVKGTREEVLQQSQAELDGALARELQAKRRFESFEKSHKDSPGAVSEITLSDARQDYQMALTARVKAEQHQQELKNGAREEEKVSAKAELEAAQVDLKRQQESRESRIASAQALVQVSEANTRLAQSALEKTIVRTPLSGTVVYRYKNPGEAVIAFQNDPVVMVANTDELRVRADVDESDYPRVHVGQRVKVTADAFDAYFDGIVEKRSEKAGNKRFSTGAAKEKMDVKVVEVLIRFPKKTPFLLGLRVTAYFEDKAPGEGGKRGAQAAQDPAPAQP